MTKPDDMTDEEYEAALDLYVARRSSWYNDHLAVKMFLDDLKSKDDSSEEDE